MKLLLVSFLVVAGCYAAIAVDAGSASDVYFWGGSSWTIPPTSTLPSGTDMTLRFGPSFTYRIPADGEYIVQLTLMEPNQAAVGARVFSVAVNGQVIAPNIDLVKQVGMLKPYVIAFDACTISGVLELAFTATVRTAVVSTISLQRRLPPLDIDGEAPIGVRDGTNSVFTLNAVPWPAASLHLFRNGLRQKPGNDYTLANNVITLVGKPPDASELILADYRQLVFEAPAVPAVALSTAKLPGP